MRSSRSTTIASVGVCTRPTVVKEAAGLGVERGHRTRAVDADQPVRFGAADRGVAQALDLLRGAQVGESVADRLRGHRLQPQALHRLLAAGVLGDEVEDQLAFCGPRHRR